MKRRKGFVNDRIQFMIFSILFIVGISSLATFIGVSGVNCSDPANILDKPSDNATTVDRVIGPANDLVNVLFGCSSQNQLLNAVFLSLQAGMILILLFIAKDLVPFT